jgi:transposase
MLAERVDAVIGVDTHQDTHCASIVTTVGAELAVLTVPANPSGHRRLLDWAGNHAPTDRIIWAVEGSRSYGTGLVRALHRAGHWVVEADRPQRNHRPHGKNDNLDARRAATAALAREHHAAPRTDGPREAARILLVTRDSAVKARTAAMNALKALITTASDADRQKLRGLTAPALIQTCLRLRVTAANCVEDRVRRTALKRLAGRIKDLTSEIREADAELLALARTHVPQLLDQRGIGVVTATQAWISWSAPGRFRNEAAFAALAGTSPLPATSGRTIRHRLNRGGDRALNQALHHIAVTLERCDPATRDYVARRTADGKSRKEIRRCLKRYLARKLYRLLENGPASAPTTT